MATKTITVTFFSLEPGTADAFVRGGFPREQLFEVLRRMDPADEGIKLTRSMLGGQDFCHLREDGPMPLLVGFFKDNVWTPTQERKGEVKEVLLDEDAGIVDLSYVMFFPKDVVGVLLSSKKAPGPNRISNWLRVISGIDFYMQRLPEVSALERVRSAGLVRRFEIAVKVKGMGRVRDAANSGRGIRAAFEMAATGVSAPSSSVQISGKALAGPTEASWSSDVVSQVEDLLSSDTDLVSLKVWTKGRRKPYDLTSACVAWSEDINLPSRKLKDVDAAQFLTRAYDECKAAISKSLNRTDGGR